MPALVGTRETGLAVLNKIKESAPGKTGRTPPAVELISVSKWRGSIAQIDRRFVRNESLQTLIELMMSIRHVKDHRKGSVKDKLLEPLLKSVNLTIERGAVVGIIDIGGRSRDALVRILGNAEIPSAGVVKFYGKSASLGQLGASDYPYLTCRQNLELGARLVGIPKKDIGPAMARVPKFSGLGEHLDTPSRRLERATIVDLGISFLCCLDYDIMVADDINRPRTEKVEARWREYIKTAPERGKTVIATSGNTGNLAGVCTHLLLIKDAELFSYGPADDIEARHADFIEEARTTPRADEGRTAGLDDEDEDGELM
jgi:ABC-type polysaccharide/polyol phosphate transport system ATPase subunit